MHPVSPHAVKAMLADGEELALIDVREELTYSENHLLWARSVPLSRLELRFARLVPRLSTRIVLCDDADGLAQRAADVLARAGYSNLAYLDGGVAAWAAAGFELFSGVYVPSKAFGEFIEHACETPNIGPEELNRLIETAPTWSCSTAGRSMNTAASRSRPRPTCRAPSWCCACATWRPRPRRWSWSTAPAAPAASSARNR